MRLLSRDGAFADLRPVGYQVQAGPAEDEREDWDEWLVVRCEVRAGDGRGWSFADPCLTVQEAGCLPAWLRDIAAGAIAAAQRCLLFTEPNLAFSTGGDSSERARFSYGSLPPWLPRDRHDWRTAQHSVLLDVSKPDLLQAAQAWDAERSPFPQR